MATSKSFLEKEQLFQGTYSKTVLKSIYQAYRPYRFSIFFFLSIGFLGRLLLLSNANLVGQWVDSFCLAPAPCKPAPAFLSQWQSTDYVQALVLLTLAGVILTWVYRLGFSRRSAKAVSQLYDEVTLRVSRAPMRFFDTTPIGRIITRFSSDYGNVFRLFGGPLAEFLAIIFELVSMLILITLASPYYLPIVFIIGGLNYLIYRANREQLRHERRLLSAIRSPSIAHFAETVQGASAIRVFARQKTFFERFKKLNDDFLHQRVRTSRKVYGFSLQMTTTTAALLLLTGWLGYEMAHWGWVSVGSIGVAFTFITLSGSSIMMFFEWLAQFEEAMTGMERLDEYLRRDLEPTMRLPSSAQFETGHPKYTQELELQSRNVRWSTGNAGRVDVRDLNFRYAADLPLILKNLNFTIEAGEKIGVVGRTGSGKSSLVQALFYLYPFEKGEIAIDGKAPSWQEDKDLNVYRRSIALISQEPTLFRGTLRENLTLLTGHTDEELLHALEKVGMGDWLSHHPEGLDSFIDERGRNLSAGEKQLVCMARCLLQDAPVVVMDEATSHVDPQSEQIMVQATHEFFKDRTQIIIAHRLSTLEGCDRILWLDKGEVRMFAAPLEVLQKYQDIYTPEI